MWIGHYANIYKTGFSFTNKYHFVASDTTIEISRIETDSLDLFNESFVNIVAIAGENGSGKTSLFSFVENFFLEDTIHMHNNVKLVYKDNNGILKVYGVEGEKIKCHADIPFEAITVLTELQHQVIPLYFSSGIETRNEFQIQSKFGEITGEKLLKDKQIEVNKVLIQQIESIFTTYDWPNVSPENLDKFEQDKRWLLHWSNAIPAYKNDDLKRIIHFICKHNPEEYKFIPSWLEIGLNFNFYDKYRELYSDDSVLYARLESIMFNPVIHPPYDDAKYKKHFKEAIICELFMFLFICSKRMVTFHEFNIIDLVNSLKGKERVEEIVEEIITFIEGANFRSSGNLIHFHKLKELVQNIDEKINDITIDSFHQGTYILVKDENTLRFINAFFEFWNINEFAFFFRWSRMSAGENALLTLLSRMFSIPEYNDINENKTIWLFIDEGELYFHPEWQRKFFSDIHRYLPKFFNRNKIQLFLTTHSPFILSDLPKENVILLKKGDSGSGCQVVVKDDIPQTFGANIHELLANSFFMSCTTGSFALEKISEVVKFVKGEEQTSIADNASAQVIINTIGEPVVRKRLQDLLNQKKSKQELIDFYKEEIKKLEGNNDD